MKLEVVSHIVSFVGKPTEMKQAERALAALAEEMGIENPAYFDNGDDKELDYGFAYDQKWHTVQEIKDTWKQVKKTLK